MEGGERQRDREGEGERKRKRERKREERRGNFPSFDPLEESVSILPPIPIE